MVAVAPVAGSVAGLGAVGVVATSCGSAQELPPAPLAYHFDDMYVAAIPLDQKQSVVTAQNDWSLAKMEKAKADADVSEAGTQIDIARNGRDAAKLDESSAISRKKAADASADLNRINQATKELAAAQQATAAAEERLVYITAYRTWLGRLLRFTEANMYWRESQYELAKATLAKKNNIQPAGFNFPNYSAQELDRAKASIAAKNQAERDRATTTQQRDKWRESQRKADAALGKTSQFYDPMADKLDTHVTPTANMTTGNSPAASDSKIPDASNPAATPAK